MAKKLCRGDRVTCRWQTAAYYSNYGGRPVMIFRPGMVATVVNPDCPKVCIYDGPGQDRRSTFVVVEYDCPETGRTERTGLNHCNVLRVPSGQ